MKKTLYVLALLGVVASPAFAADGASAAVGYYTMAALTAGLTMAIVAFGAALAQGKAVAAAMEGIARQPSAAGKIQINMIIGLALIESLAIYALVIALILLFVNPFQNYLG